MTGNKEKLDEFVKIVGVLFTDKECLVLSKEFQLPENSQVVLRVPRRNNLYCFNLSDINLNEMSPICWQKHPKLSLPNSIEGWLMGLEGITVMPEPHNKMGLLKERINPHRGSKNYAC
ncbi:hypothetical protein Tco_0030289 [Tanacetum coccineum]